MTLGKTIQIFLPDGNPRSIKIAEITSRTVQVLLIPRSKLDEAAKRDELRNVGMYCLTGPHEDISKPLIYIGESEDCLDRLKQHNKKKDFWTHALVIVSRTEHFTKTHIKFLEYYAYQQAEKAGRYRLENNQTPPKPHISESMQADLLDNFETISMLVSTLGYPLFDLVKKPTAREVLFCKGKVALAEGEYTEDGLIVFAGSTCSLHEGKSAGVWTVKLRKELFDSGVLEQNEDIYTFTQNHIFSSPSAAAVVVLGRNANGWIEWKYKDGRTLDEVKRPSV